MAQKKNLQVRPPHPLSDLLRQVQRIEIAARRSVTELFAGQYRSVFRGQGVEFDEVRPYQPGDDVRSIDWNVTARTGEPFIKRFSEERELTLYFLVDVSASGAFGTRHQAKITVAAEVAAMLMLAALKNHDKVGLLTFCQDIEHFTPPAKGRSHILGLIRQLVDVHPIPQPTNLARPLEFLNRVARRRAVVFLISDFLDELPGAALGITHRRHDLTALTIQDPREQELPPTGLLRLQDAETGEQIEVDTAHPRVREAFARQAKVRHRELRRTLRQRGIDHLDLDCSGDHALRLRRFFAARQQRLAHHTPAG